MQRSHHNALASCAAVMLSGLIAAGLGLAVLDARQAKVAAAEAAREYTPAVTYTAPQKPTKAAFLGDSFTAGTGVDQNKFHRWSTILANENGWLELNYGKGGTNYNTAGTLAGGMPYSDRLTDLVLSQPDIVIVSTAGNDMDKEQGPGIEKTFQILREELPKTRIIATSPYYRAGDYPAEFAAFGADIEREVEAVRGEYLDIGHPLGNHHDAMDEDKVHPNDDGYRLIADAVGKALK